MVIICSQSCTCCVLVKQKKRNEIKIRNKDKERKKERKKEEKEREKESKIKKERRAVPSYELPTSLPPYLPQKGSLMLLKLGKHVIQDK